MNNQKFYDDGLANIAEAVAVDRKGVASCTSAKHAAFLLSRMLLHDLSADIMQNMRAVTLLTNLFVVIV